jgi:hypothetical protein
MCETRNETDQKTDYLSVTIDHNVHHAFKGLGPVDRFGQNITTQKPL